MKISYNKALVLALTAAMATIPSGAWGKPPVASGSAGNSPTASAEAGAASGLSPVQAHNIWLLKQSMAANRAGDSNGFEIYNDKDFTVYESTGLPYGGTYHGAQGVAEIVRKMGEFWSSVTPLSVNYIPYGDDKVLVHSIARRTVRATGKELEMHTMGMWQFKDGKAVSVRVFFFDTKLATDMAKAQ